VLVSEIVDCGLLGEGIIPTLRDAFTRLCAPGVTAIPCGARVYAVGLNVPPQVWIIRWAV